jgi:Capsule polysaccharide biosynthesis protein
VGSNSLDAWWERVAARIRRPIGRQILLRDGHVRELERLGRSCRNGSGGGPRVLVVALRNWTTHTAYESVIAQGLRLRGAKVALVTCGGGQPLCELGWSRRLYPLPCDRCAWFTDRVAAAARLQTFRLADQFAWAGDGRRAPESPDALGPTTIDPREAADISVPWVLRTPEIEAAPEGLAAANDLAVSAAAVEGVARRILQEFSPEVVFLVNGLFAAERVFRSVAAEQGIRVATYEIAPRGNALVFSQGEPAPLYDTSVAWEAVRDQPLSSPQRKAIDLLLVERAKGVGAHERYFDSTVDEAEAVRTRLMIRPESRIVTLYTNLAWDSAVLHRDLAYDSMNIWINAVVEAVSRRPHMTLIVRIHPAEHSWGTRQPVLEALHRASLPENVRIVGAADAINSYTLLELSDVVLTYASTIGLEAAVSGHPVVVAAKTHYRDCGFTIDISSHDELERCLDTAVAPSPEQVELARRYAFTFFFRCMVPFPAVNTVEGHATQVPDDGGQLLPGKDPYLDFVCERILKGGDFVLPDSLALSDVST